MVEVIEGLVSLVLTVLDYLPLGMLGLVLLMVAIR
jgi:hypothetical protein